MLKKSILFGTSAVLTVALAAPVMAQTADEDIVYTTATKRQTTLQETPVAVTVTTADVIEKARILDIADLQSSVPSLRVTQLQSSQNTNFIIRGFGNGANNAGIEPSVGIFIDGVYRSRSAAQIGDLPVLESVEVLRGPQSTLFGKNASAGVVSVNTAKPKFETQGYFEAGIGNYDSRTAKAYVTGALGGSDNVAYSLGGGINKRDGYGEGQNGLDDLNDRDRMSVRGQLLIEPTEQTSVRLIADFSKIDENCCLVTNFQNDGAAAAILGLGGQLANDGDPFAREGFQNKDAVNKVDDFGISAQLDHDFENFTLTSISAYRSNDSFYDTDADYGTLDLLEGVSSDQEIDTLSQELRLTSTGDNTIDWMVGAYLFNENVKSVSGLDYGPDLRNYIDALAGPGTVSGIEALHGLTPGVAFGDQVQTTETFNQDNTAYSVFGTLDFHVNDRLTATVGLNYTNDEKDVSGMTVNNDEFSAIDFDTDLTVFGVSFVDFNILQAANLAPNPTNLAFLQSLNGGANYAAIQQGVLSALAPLRGLQFQPQFVSFPNNVESGSTEDSKLTWTGRLAYEVNDNWNVYGTVATGFKSSSWNLSRDSRPFMADQAAIEGANLAQGNQDYRTRYAGPENAIVYEIGAKTRFENGALNMALFIQNIEDFQSNTFLGTGFALVNAGEQETKGFEFDGTYSPNEAWDLSLAGTFLDAEYIEFTNAPQGDLSGESVAGIPEISLVGAATYNGALSNGMEWYMRGEYQYESEVQVVEDIATAATQPQRTINNVNASAGLDFGNGLKAQVWARNLFEDEYFLSAFPGVAQAGIVNAYPNQPRTYGINLRQEF